MIKVFTTGPLDTHAYIITCPDTKETVVIDAPYHSTKAICKYISDNQLKPTKILFTHSHLDHTVDAHNLKEQLNVPAYIHEADAYNLERPGSDGLLIWLAFQGLKPDGYLSEGETINVGKLKFKIIHTPGHTPGGVCFYCPEKEWLFTGDTLFKGTIGNLSFSTCNAEDMWASLIKLSKLPPSTKVFPGHGENTTLADEPWLPEAEKIFG